VFTGTSGRIVGHSENGTFLTVNDWSQIGKRPLSYRPSIALLRDHTEVPRNLRLLATVDSAFAISSASSEAVRSHRGGGWVFSDAACCGLQQDWQTVSELKPNDLTVSKPRQLIE